MNKSSISGQIGDVICWSFILLLVHLKMVNQCFMWQFSLKITIQTMMIEIINFERHYRYWTFKFRRHEKSSKIKYFHHHFYKQDQTLSDMIISMIISLIIFAHRNFWRLNFFSEISKKISLIFCWDFPQCNSWTSRESVFTLMWKIMVKLMNLRLFPAASHSIHLLKLYK